MDRAVLSPRRLAVGEWPGCGNDYLVGGGARGGAGVFAAAGGVE